MTPLHRLLADDRAPDALVAWRCDAATPCRWHEFRASVAGLASSLAPRPEQSWLLAEADPLEFAIALFALWHAGKRVVLPPSLQFGAVAELAKEVDATWSRSTVSLDEKLLPALDPTRVRLDLYTSGSTGEPKRIGKTLAQLEAEVAVLEALWGGDAHPVLATVPHHHIYGLLFRLLWPLAAGRPFDAETCAAPELLLARLTRLGGGRVISSPAQLGRMHELIDLTSLQGRVRHIHSSGGPLAPEAAGRFRAALGAAPTEVLGSTETGGIAWRRQGENHGDDAWTPFPGVRVECGEDNALLLRSPFLPDGQPLATSDAVQLGADGRFHLLGRLDRIVKIEEKRLALADMESRLNQHPWVREAAVLPLPGRRPRLGAVLALTPAGAAELAAGGRLACARALRRYLAQWFDPVLLPRAWRYPDSLPYNERGKLPLDQLLPLFESASDTRKIEMETEHA